jgi:hypothetical protein
VPAGCGGSGIVDIPMLLNDLSIGIVPTVLNSLAIGDVAMMYY